MDDVLKQKTNKSFLERFSDRLSSLFGFVFKRSGSKKGKKDIPVEFVEPTLHSPPGTGERKIRIRDKKLSDNLEKMLSAYLNDTYETSETLTNREQRYRQLEYAYVNDPIIGAAVSMTADEAASIDSKERIIQIETDNPKMTKACYDLLTHWGVTNSLIRGIAFDLALYGDAFLCPRVTEKGVERITPVHPSTIVDRYEFAPAHLLRRHTYEPNKQGNTLFGSVEKVQAFLSGPISRNEAIQRLIKSLEQDSITQISDMFDSTLFGFQLSGGFVAPPWNIIHMRITGEQSEYWPFGKPLFIHILAPFRQLSATMSLQALARVYSFPIRVFSVDTKDVMTQEDKMEKVNEVREYYEGLGVYQQSPESYTVNTTIWTAKDLVEASVHSTKADYNFVEDIELLQNRVIIGTGIPKGYLIVDNQTFGQSGIALLRQHKPFARRVFTIQSAICDGLIDLLRLHFSITGEFDFTAPIMLSLRFSEDEVTDESLNKKRTSLELAKDLIDTISTYIGVREGEVIPIEIVSDILERFTFLDKESMEKYLRILLAKRYNKTILSTLPPEEGKEEGGEFPGGIADVFGGGGGMDLGGGPGGEGMGPGASAGKTTQEPTGGAPQSGLAASRKARTVTATKREILEEARKQRLLERYSEVADLITLKYLEKLRINEGVMNGRHFVLRRGVPRGQEYLRILSELRKQNRLKESINVEFE